jgi:hypothetical protein
MPERPPSTGLTLRAIERRRGVVLAAWPPDIHSVTLVNFRDGERTTPLLVQIDPHYTFHKAERGRPRLFRFERAAWNAESLAPLHPIAASFTACDTDLPQIRFVMDPELPVTQGTRKIR